MRHFTLGAGERAPGRGSGGPNAPGREGLLCQAGGAQAARWTNLVGCSRWICPAASLRSFHPRACRRVSTAEWWRWAALSSRARLGTRWRSWCAPRRAHCHLAYLATALPRELGTKPASAMVSPCHHTHCCSPLRESAGQAALGPVALHRLAVSHIQARREPGCEGIGRPGANLLNIKGDSPCKSVRRRYVPLRWRLIPLPGPSAVSISLCRSRISSTRCSTAATSSGRRWARAFLVTLPSFACFTSWQRQRGWSFPLGHDLLLVLW